MRLTRATFFAMVLHRGVTAEEMEELVAWVELHPNLAIRGRLLARLRASAGESPVPLTTALMWLPKAALALREHSVVTVEAIQHHPTGPIDFSAARERSVTGELLPHRSDEAVDVDAVRQHSMVTAEAIDLSAVRVDEPIDFGAVRRERWMAWAAVAMCGLMVAILASQWLISPERTALMADVTDQAMAPTPGGPANGTALEAERAVESGAAISKCTAGAPLEAAGGSRRAVEPNAATSKRAAATPLADAEGLRRQVEPNAARSKRAVVAPVAVDERGREPTTAAAVSTRAIEPVSASGGFTKKLSGSSAREAPKPHDPLSERL